MPDNHARLSPALVETIAGLSAGTISTLVVHPLDVVKTRLQSKQFHMPNTAPHPLLLIFSLLFSLYTKHTVTDIYLFATQFIAMNPPCPKMASQSCAPSSRTNAHYKRSTAASLPIYSETQVHGRSSSTSNPSLRDNSFDSIIALPPLLPPLLFKLARMPGEIKAREFHDSNNTHSRQQITSSPQAFQES